MIHDAPETNNPEKYVIVSGFGTYDKRKGNPYAIWITWKAVGIEEQIWNPRFPDSS